MQQETIIIEDDGKGLPWEGCVNSVNYRIERGVKVAVPAAVAELRRTGEAEKRRSALLVARYTKADGAKL